MGGGDKTTNSDANADQEERVTLSTTERKETAKLVDENGFSSCVKEEAEQHNGKEVSSLPANAGHF